MPEGRPQRSYSEGEFYATDAITDHALDFIEESRKEMNNVADDYREVVEEMKKTWEEWAERTQVYPRSK